MFKLSFITLILISLYSATLLSCSTDTASTKPGSSTEGTAQLDSTEVTFSGSNQGPWQLQVEELDTLSDLYKVKKTVNADSLDFTFSFDNNEFYKITLINLSDSSYYVRDINPNLNSAETIVINNTMLNSSLILINRPLDCQPLSVNKSPSKVLTTETEWKLIFIAEGYSSIEWESEECNLEYPTLHLENDTIQFIETRVIDTGSRQIVGIWTFDSNKIETIPSKGLEMEVQGDFDFLDNEVYGTPTTHIKISPVMGVNQSIMKTYSYTMILDFAPLDTGWFPLFALDSLNKPDYPKVWIHTEQGIFSEDKDNQITHKFEVGEIQRLAWVSDQIGKTITWYMNGIEIGLWSDDLFYELDLGVHIDEDVYLFGSYNDDGIPFKVKAVYNFNDKLSSEEIALFATFKPSEID